MPVGRAAQRRLRCLNPSAEHCTASRFLTVRLATSRPNWSLQDTVVLPEYEALGDTAANTLVMAKSASPPDLGRWVHRKEKFERAVLAGASGFIFVSEHPGVGPETGSLQNNRPAPIPRHIRLQRRR